MRELRRQLIGLLDESRKQQGTGEIPPRLAAALVHDFTHLLENRQSQKVALQHRLLTHGQLHRHVMTIRCPDQAFYLDAIKGYMNRHGIQPLDQQTLIMHMECDEDGCILSIHAPDDQQHQNIMFIAVHISATLQPDGDALSRDMLAILQAVELSVHDFPAMRNEIDQCIQRLEGLRPEDAKLLHWMSDDKYLFFGMQAGKQRFGLLHNKHVLERVAKGLVKELESLPEPTQPGVEWLHLRCSQNYLYSAASLEVVRINIPSEADAKVLESYLILGHFSRAARYASASRTPRLEGQWADMLNHPLMIHSAFYRREIRTIYDRLPKHLLLAIDGKRLVASLKHIVDLTGTAQTTAVILSPAPGSVFTIMATIPSARFGPNVERDLEARLKAHDVIVHGVESFGIGIHRIMFLSCEGSLTPESESRIANDIQQSVIFWKDRAKNLVLKNASRLDIPQSLAALAKLPHIYEDLFPPEAFLLDLNGRKKALEENRTIVRIAVNEQMIDVHIYSLAPIALGKLVTIVQAFGITALQESVVNLGHDDERVFLSSLRCECEASISPGDAERLGLGLEHVLNGEASDDGANALLLKTGLGIMQVEVLLALRNHLVQILPDAAPMALTQMLNSYPKSAEKLYRMFEARHRPAMPVTMEAQAALEFENSLASVANLTEDRWFRALAELVQAGLRSNAFIRRFDEPVVFKIDPSRLSFAEPPLPFREIFVHGVYMEGVHLRAGKVARGGIRYSDRPADYRTEVQELMATQITKNSIIVPTGAKGGFVVRGGSGAEFVKLQYRTFIRSLLSLTDNLVQNECSPPAGIRLHPDDANDPYLVVAADKGTARFSDTANEEARLACFWLDDAFASGGSHGYDHKAVGITARGAWVCGNHHFEAMGQNAYQDPIRAVGIGDMSGDVFGNGMLLNPNLQLIAAFNHRHIFLDPIPDTAKAFAERRRLFAEGKDWEEYNQDIISKGGGIFSRFSKRIALSEEARLALGVSETALPGQDLVRAILQADVDLLYNGGIGTYVKAADQSHAEVRDPANNAVRINADELRCKVVAEGGNLGFTQEARIQYAAAGGRINTDAIDNSGGVDMSDHEVNLKILFSGIPSLTPGKRNRALKELTEEITGQCLSNNLKQARALSLALLEAHQHPFRFQRLCRHLIDIGRINPHTDPGFDTPDTLALRPQLAVMLGHEKNRLKDGLLEQGFTRCGHRLCDDLLHQYFPKSIRKHHPEAIAAHPLAQQIMATQAANRIVNDMGLGCAQHIESLLDSPLHHIAMALFIADDILETEPLRKQIWKQLDSCEISCQTQYALQEQLTHFAEDILRYFDIEALEAADIDGLRVGIRTFRGKWVKYGVGGMENSSFLALLKTVTQAGLDAEHAAHLASIPALKQMAAALYLAHSQKLPLQRCLAATEVVLQLLPINELENALRSPYWGEEAAHALRREWLHRLSLLKSKAVQALLDADGKDFLSGGQALWGQHRHWDDVQKARDDIKALLDNASAGTAPPDNERLKLLLTLSQLETLIDES